MEEFVDRLIAYVISDMCIRHDDYDYYTRIRSSPVFKDPDVRRHALKTLKVLSTSLILFILVLILTGLEKLNILKWEDIPIYFSIAMSVFIIVFLLMILHSSYKMFSLLSERTNIRLFKSSGIMICIGISLILLSELLFWVPILFEKFGFVDKYGDIVIGPLKVDEAFIGVFIPLIMIPLGVFIITLGYTRLGVAWRKYLKIEKPWDKEIF